MLGRESYAGMCLGSLAILSPQPLAFPTQSRWCSQAHRAAPARLPSLASPLALASHLASPSLWEHPGLKVLLAPTPSPFIPLLCRGLQAESGGTSSKEKVQLDSGSGGSETSSNSRGSHGRTSSGGDSGCLHRGREERQPEGHSRGSVTRRVQTSRARLPC